MVEDPSLSLDQTRSAILAFVCVGSPAVWCNVDGMCLLAWVGRGKKNIVRASLLFVLRWFEVLLADRNALDVNIMCVWMIWMNAFGTRWVILCKSKGALMIDVEHFMLLRIVRASIALLLFAISSLWECEEWILLRRTCWVVASRTSFGYLDIEKIKVWKWPLENITLLSKLR